MANKVEAICKDCGAKVWTLFPKNPRCHDCAGKELDRIAAKPETQVKFDATLKCWALEDAR